MNPANMPPKAPIIHLDALELYSQTHGEHFAAAFAAITAPLGATRLGARLVEVPAGKKAWPFHCHHANDEMFVILSGHGTVRFGDNIYAVKTGDVVVCPAGGPETAHQLQAGTNTALRYIAISSMNEPDILQYPDSGKVALFAGAAPGGDKAKRRLSLNFATRDAIDYWEGEN
ncbi:cupin domain-containing protein [Thalassospira sp. MCCC 1A01428]|uniref:cupin domain-containing protein n=1 Tax=Thalassospira sp. MCCC 1A01428 TaxID=1470575 RepID=UPI000A1DB4C9|nr:cupin domain-containing protein [Thalassospira sp. MCCC 1A01428]OSQ38718.1 cupin [Thalassospira sp. MCCC 1A01428]